MESLRLLILLTVLIVHVFCYVDDSPGQETDVWAAENWKDELPETKFINQFEHLIKRGKYQQFYGLMGKRSTGVPQVVPLGQKRHKGEMFVGLMGRRSSNRELPQDWERSSLYTQRRK
ncbi:protachykinin-1-like [Latimeria chalumnae]|uniref:protachykinin-1-like n=1 Tax=Latimeria chalumnae TaxID=7897 RepID=UPI0003C187EF|nr:PREDICTED: protachykinin-1-like [Latimeria chalumnae]|eukprot:XP_006000902.1 PREDICTED: protachykinin-1-like [Latimeria chalumnae]